MDENEKRELARLECELRELERTMSLRLAKIRRRVERIKAHETPKVRKV